MSWWRAPVCGAAKHADRGKRPDLLSAHIVREAAAVYPHAAGQDAHDRLCAINQRTTVVPMQNARPSDEQAFAFGLVGGVAPLACNAQDHFPVYTGFLLLPGRGERFVFIIVVFGIVAAQSAIDTILGKQHVIGRGHANSFAVGGLNKTARHAARHALGRPALIWRFPKFYIERICEVCEFDLNRFVVAIYATEHRIEGNACCGVFVLVVPTSAILFFPAKTNRAPR